MYNYADGDGLGGMENRDRLGKGSRRPIDSRWGIVAILVGRIISIVGNYRVFLKALYFFMRK